jgi:50S ribosomal subunit-associated GTPase HflX
MKKKNGSGASAFELDALWKNAERTARVLSHLVGDGLGAALRGLGFVTAADLEDIDRALERLEARMKKLEARRRSARPKRAAPAEVEHRASVPR